MDKTQITIKVYRETKPKIKLLAALVEKNQCQVVKDLVDKALKKAKKDNHI